MSQIQVTVTGASGFLATSLTKALLVKGYHVKATVRSVADPVKVQPLRDLEKGTTGKLELVEADLLTPDSFDKAVEGSTYVFHTASPFFLSHTDNPQRDLVEPAEQGTLNLLKSALKYKSTVKRVVVTSSQASIRSWFPDEKPKNGSLWTEEDWNDKSSLTAGPYLFSKVRGEKVAWEFSEKNGLDVVVILPAFILGPFDVKRTDSESVQWIVKLFAGETSTSTLFGVCDLRDVVAAHIAAAENPKAKGRYLVTNGSAVNPSRAAQILKDAFPESKVDVEKNKAGDLPATPLEADNSKVQKELGIKLHTIEETFVDMAKSAKQLGLI